ncbi:MAG: HAMP domain-containing protein, partial [Phreatobacter sp.]|nr:HAMP domain-containing protein [Phreatobacter sp.]
MAILGRFRTTPKILAVVIFLNALICALGWMAFSALSHVAKEAQESSEAGARAVAGTRANLALVLINRYEMVAASQADAESFRRSAELVRPLVAEVQREFDLIRGYAYPQVQDALRRTEQATDQAIAGTNRTLAFGLSIQGKATAEQSARLEELTRASEPLIAEARKRAQELVALLVNRSQTMAKELQSEKDSQARLIVTLVVVAVLLGTGLALLIGQFGIARPIRAINETLASLADGKFDVKVTGTERKDEVGDIARAAEIFKANGIET